MSITDELSTLYNTKRSIKQAIISKGVDVPDDTVFADYANKIELIGNNDFDFFSMRTLNNTNYNWLFAHYKGTSLDLKCLDVSNVTSMDRTFFCCEYLTELDVSNWDTNSVTNMHMMFLNNSSLTSLDLSNWKTNNVTSTQSMFENCSSLTEVNLSNFDLSKTPTSASVYKMFYGCTSLHTLRLDNCNNTTINKIITSGNFPTGTISGVTRKIYCKEANAAGLTAPTNWVFEYID